MIAKKKKEKKKDLGQDFAFYLYFWRDYVFPLVPLAPRKVKGKKKSLCVSQIQGYRAICVCCFINQRIM